MTTSVTLDALNGMTPSSFVAELGEVFEHAPWVAEGALCGRPYGTVAALHDAMMGVVRAPRPTASMPSSPDTPNWAAGWPGGT